MIPKTPFLPSLTFCTDALIQHRYGSIIQNAEQGILKKFYFKFFMKKPRALRLLGLLACAQKLSGGEVSDQILQVLAQEDFLKHFLLLSSLTNSQVSGSMAVRESAQLYSVVTEEANNFDHFIQTRKKDRWAIVGNAPIRPEYNNAGKGDEIDSADVVVRFNNFKTEGFEKDIGGKTDIHARISNISAAYPGIPVLLTDDPLRHYLQAEAIESLLGQKIYTFSRQEEKIFAEDFANIPSSGFKLLWVLNRLGCENVRVYGFSFLNSAQIPDSFEHYFEKTKKERLHNIADEILLLRELYSKNTSQSGN